MVGFANQGLGISTNLQLPAGTASGGKRLMPNARSSCGKDEQ
jgi:hypothetical protein